MDWPFVSVIVPVYNGEDSIGETIQKILAQNYQGQKEIIIVNDGSKDQTEQIVRTYPVIYLCQDNAGPASARNLGAKHARGNILVFTDADCCAEQHWLSRLMEGFVSDDIGAVAGSYSIANKQFMLARIIHDEIRFRHEHLMPDFPQAFGSYNVAIKKEVFQKVLGFSTGYRCASGEDNDLSYKILKAGYKIKFVKNALVAHYHQTHVWKYLKEQYRHGFWRVRMYKEHPQMVKGDGYTFWKDIIEPILVMMFFMFCLVSLPMGFVFLGAFFVFELVFSLLMMKQMNDCFLGGIVFLCRSFARTIGFLYGIILNIKKN